MGFPVTRFEIAAQDIKGTREFYTQMFAWHMESDPIMRYSRVRTGDGIDGSIIGTGNGTPFVTVYVEVDDIQILLRKAEALGGAVYVPPTPSPVEGEALFAVIGDPEGNLIGLVQAAA